ncbi:MAG TPA: glycosyltransferase [Cyclobacteriaceae bacterium]|nr:glycosyltransferase [Cyclobacteriaceae bacterium]
MTTLNNRVCVIATAGPWWDHRYFHKQIPALVNAGWDVRFICQDPGRSVSADCKLVPLSYRQRRWARFTGGISLLKKILKIKPRAIQLSSIELLPLGIFVSLFTGISVFYDCREDMRSAMREHKTRFPVAIRNLLGAATEMLEVIAGKVFAGFVVSDPKIYEIQNTVPPEKKLLFYNMPLLRQFPGNYRKLKDREFDFALVGSMSVRTGVVEVIQALAMLARSGEYRTLCLIGEPDPEAKKIIIDIIKKSGIEAQVKITGRLEYDKVPDEIRRCRIGLIPLLDLKKFRNNMATKQFEYMACGMPIISSDLPPQRIFIEEGLSGRFVKPGDIEALANAMSEMAADTDTCQKMGEYARKKVESEWNAEVMQQLYIKFYKEILGAPA